MKTTTKLLCFFSGLLLLFSVTGVYAVWDYTDQDGVNPKDQALSVTLSMPPPVEWDNKDTLPAEHARLLEIFINEINNEESIIHGHIEDRHTGLLGTGWFSKGTLGSMDEEHGAALLELFSCENSDFMLEFQMNADGTYRSLTMYTTEVDLSKLSGGWVSPVYKTILSYDTPTGLWTIEESIEGRAPFGYYDEEGKLWFQEDIPSFDTGDWEEI